MNNIFLTKSARAAIRDLDSLTSAKERAELELSVTSRWNPVRRLDLMDTISQLNKEISAITAALAVTPSYGF